MFKRGVYETFSGNRAVVAQLRSINGESWLLRGAIHDHDNIFVMHAWNIDGKSFSNAVLNLKSKDQGDQIRTGQTA